MTEFTAFDLDHTILNGDSDYLWGEYLVEKKILTAESWSEHNQRFYQQYQEGSLRIQEYLRMAFGVLQQYPMEQLKIWRNEYYREKIVPLFRPKAVELVKRSLEAGDVLVLITATNRFIAEVSAQHLGIKNLIASEAEMANGQFTGEFSGTPCYREGKIIRLKQWLADNGYDADKDIKKFRFYSDSHNDVFLLEEVGTAFAVNPDEKLKKIAEEKNWTVLDLNG
ncbi:MAG: HAD-IB family hydrolase [Gammaproteobacteria bacterium]|nr:HAD-IB family hydrolase [Pseudomonadota bacterium]MCH9663564.1 HAD-IB family hydrolase [Gammaproteobacteria bacterium]